MVKVKCINAKGVKLVQDHIYEVSYSNSTKIGIKGLGYYIKSRFETLDGSDITKLYLKYTYRDWEEININDLNQYIKCRSDSGSKQLIAGQLYKVIQINVDNSYGRNRISSIKLEGLKGTWTPWRFEKANIKEQRTIKLKKMDGEKIQQKFDRKFDSFDENKKLLIILRMIADISEEKEKMGYNIPLHQLICQRDRQYGLTEEDLKSFIEVKLKTLLNYEK